MFDRRLREMGLDPDGDPGEIMREVARRAKAMRELLARLEDEADAPVIVDAKPEPR